MELTPARERVAEALAIERAHGADAPRWIAQRINALRRAGDRRGVERFQQIETHLERLATPPTSLC